MNGLNSNEVRYRVNNGLVNNENIRYSRSIGNILLSNILTLFNLIHLFLFCLVLTTGALNNTTFIVAIVFNVFISIYQEIKAKKIIDKLIITNISKVKVIRNSLIVEIMPNEIVMDDILLLSQGDSLPVDAKVINTDFCEVDESIITGESEPINKKNGDLLISGSFVICGLCYAKVISINKNTYANNLIKETNKILDNTSYLNKSINLILKIVTIIIIPVGILLFITQFFYSKQTYSESILSSVAGIIGMIPEGLVLLTSISLTIGVIKIASKKVIVQKLNGIELLACVDVLCLDKTGTITDGTMKVIDIVKIEKNVDVKQILSNMIREPINQTDLALSNYFGINYDLNVVKYLPFSSIKKYSFVEFDSGMYALGALEFLTNKNFNDYNILSKYTSKGFRVITLVKCYDEFNKLTNEIICFIILEDNVRKNAKEVLNYFEKQDVQIKILSGDNPATVSNILKQLSFSGCDKFISGDMLPNDFEKLKEIVSCYTIFGRLSPYQKQSIIKILKEKNTVGMIGDGVNDILALKEADCGIALSTGISAAKNVSEIILTESNFGVLSDIVDEGRRVINNIERVASMYLIKTVYSVLLSIVCIFLSYEYPFYPVQLTLISVTCVGIPSFFLTLEPNYNKVKKNFLNKVLRNALPSGICVFVDILILILLSYVFKLDFDSFRLTIVVITGYSSLRLLYKISLPLSLSRKILIIFSSLIFVLLLFSFSSFFLVDMYNFISLIFIFVFIFINKYIIVFFEEIYDKIVL